MTTKIQQMLDAGIPVISEQSNEATNEYSFVSLTPAQREIVQDIVAPPSADELYRRENQVVDKPLIAPVMRAAQFVESPEYYVLSPKPQATKDAAIAKAKELSLMPRKALAEMVLNFMVAIEAMNAEIEVLKEKVK